MCTATWLRNASGYDLLFNRDERKTRLQAEPPRENEAQGVPWIGPRDPEAGGTWIGTNDSGLTVALLNGARNENDAEREWITRGRIVPALMPSADLAQLRGLLEALDLVRIRSFRLLAVAATEPALVAEWDRVSLAIDSNAESRIPLTSSFFDEQTVGRARRAEFDRLTRGKPLSIERLLAFHRSTEGGPSALSVSMERDEAATQSLTHVSVVGEGVMMRYHGARPDLAAAETIVRIARRTPANTHSAGRM